MVEYWLSSCKFLSFVRSAAPASLEFPEILILFSYCDLKVIFDGEEAVDAGGVTKEFFLLLLKELLNPIYGMFTYYQDSNLLWFSDTVS